MKIEIIKIPHEEGGVIGKIEPNSLVHADCLDAMKHIESKSIDMILCDLPYGTTACKWDVVIPFEPLWEQYDRVINDRGAIVLFSSQPFTTTLINSNIKQFKYEWIWEKHQGTNPMLCKVQPMKIHENICVFSKNSPLYNPQFGIGKKYNGYISKGSIGEVYGDTKFNGHNDNDGKRYPTSILKFRGMKYDGGLHPTQKPVPLLETLIRTYSNEGDIVLDNCMGSGSTGVACVNANRNFIGIEKDNNYFEIAKNRIVNYKNNDIKNKQFFI